MEFGLKNKVAVVTGASRGIGQAVALALAGEGAQIAAVATTKERVRATVESCSSLGVRARVFGVDVADHAAVQAAAEEILGSFGRIDILVNNAGVTQDGLLMRMSEGDWDRVMDVNLKGAFNMIRAFARPLLKTRGARVINVASIVGLVGNAGQANYAASKGGLIALTRSLAREFGGRGVTVNAVAPGFIETDMTAELPEAARQAMVDATALGRVGTPQDVANAVLFLASDLASYVTGHVLLIDGGARI